MTCLTYFYHACMMMDEDVILFNYQNKKEKEKKEKG
jgi:hypothetical protein